MRLAYFDCFSGIAGDMALGALTHAGADLEQIRKTLSTLPLEGLDLAAEEVDVRGIPALAIHIHAGTQGVIRTWSSIRALLDETDLPPRARGTAQRTYHRLANAAARVHAKDPELVTFHEFGDIECFVTFVGCALALDMLGVDRVFASPVPTGTGMVRTEHGVMPIPSPVVMELLQGVPTYSRGIPVELVTPTGAAILSAVSEGYGDMPMMRADHVGYGAGAFRPDFPHAVRVVIGEEQPAAAGARASVALADMLGQGEVVLQVVLAEVSVEQAERLLEDLFTAGASDAWITGVVGRGGRPGSSISAVAPADRRDQVVRCLQREDMAGPIRVAPVITTPTAT